MEYIDKYIKYKSWKYAFLCYFYMRYFKFLNFILQIHLYLIRPVQGGINIFFTKQFDDYTIISSDCFFFFISFSLPPSLVLVFKRATMSQREKKIFALLLALFFMHFSGYIVVLLSPRGSKDLLFLLSKSRAFKMNCI